MTKTLIAAAAFSILSLATLGAARADEFSNQTSQNQQGVNAYLDNQATNSQLSDPTARDSIRSHGHP